MKKWTICSLILSIMVLSALLASKPTLSQGRGQGFRPCPYAAYQCPTRGICKPLTVSGKINRVFTETIEEGMYPGMALLVDTEDHGQMHVHLGPVWYLERQDFELKPGDEVTIKGICTEAAGKTNLVAGDLTKGDYLLLLRDAQGRPMWEAWRAR